MERRGLGVFTSGHFHLFAAPVCIEADETAASRYHAALTRIHRLRATCLSEVHDQFRTASRWTLDLLQLPRPGYGVEVPNEMPRIDA